MSDAVLFERDGAIVTLTLNKPQTRNPTTDPEILGALNDAFACIAADTGISCMILTGAGKAFSAGGNLKHMRDREGGFGGNAADVSDKYRQGIQRTTLALYNLEVPTIAAVNGPAYGAGCDMACACDIRVASDDAVFAENFVKIGLISGDGGGWLLPRAVGLSRACEMTFTGDPMDAATALACGLVSRVVPNDSLMETARQLAARIASNPPRQLRMAKRLLREGQVTRLDSLLELAAALQGACHHTQDHEEAVRAFFDKRPPKFTGE
ncbi:MAG: crotonase/enoyl-CoA hydratase family protein [Pseudomonadota bacterium]|nr:crotonase/enoyl-CoA hydratase family protein [Burkholderiaceae bacterium]MDQ3446347.1 crotonase/enoyl-CoA hydratase family protein [Pseudomonadota bacterium]